MAHLCQVSSERPLSRSGRPGRVSGGGAAVGRGGWHVSDERIRLDPVRTGFVASALAAFQVGAARADELRAQAEAITDASTVKATTGKRVSQRTLDIQDGRVLVPLDIVQRAFRLARRADPSILFPELNRLTSLFDGGSGSSAAKDTEPTAAPPAMDEPAMPAGK